MEMTEDEAIKKWCPFTRLGIHGQQGVTAVNRHPDADIEADCMCRASACAVWNFTGVKRETESKRVSFEQVEGWGVPMAEIVPSKTVTPSSGPFVGQEMRISNTGRHADTREQYVDFTLFGEEVQVGQCGLKYQQP